MRHPAEEPLHAPYDPHVARRLLEFVRPYKRYVAIAVALLLLLGAAEAARPWLIKIAIDDHIAAGDVAGLWVLVVSFLALLMFDFVGGAFRSYLTTWIGQGRCTICGRGCSIGCSGFRFRSSTGTRSDGS